MSLLSRLVSRRAAVAWAVLGRRLVGSVAVGSATVSSSAVVVVLVVTGLISALGRLVPGTRAFAITAAVWGLVRATSVVVVVVMLVVAVVSAAARRLIVRSVRT